MKCSFGSFKKARVSSNVITCTDDLDGLDSILADDKTRILKLISDTNAERTRPLDQSKKINKTAIGIPNASSLGYRPKLSPMKTSSIKVMYTNADQLTPSKKTELIKKIENQKPIIIAICEVKTKNSKDRCLLDFDIPNYNLHPLNLENDVGRGMALYSHMSIARSIIQIKPEIACDEVCMLEISLRGGDTLLLGCCYRSPTKSDTSAENNAKVNQFLKWVSESKHSQVRYG